MQMLENLPDIIGLIIRSSIMPHVYDCSHYIPLYICTMAINIVWIKLFVLYSFDIKFTVLPQQLNVYPMSLYDGETNIDV